MRDEGGEQVGGGGRISDEGNGCEGKEMSTGEEFYSVVQELLRSYTGKVIQEAHIRL